jgi:hypothetical protein
VKPPGQEAREEAALIGRPSKKPIGIYGYFNCREGHFNFCRVDVYLPKLDKQLKTWREKGQLEAQWFTLAETAQLVEATGLVALLQDLARKGISKSATEI